METTDAINWLTQKDVKPTSNRILVLKKLKAEARPVTLLDLSNKMLTMDKSSIFRVLTLFAQHDVVHAFEDGRGVVHYELCHHDGDDHHSHGHLHFYCEQCQQTYCLEDVAIPTIEMPDGFHPHSVSFVVKGICPKCNER